MIPDLTHTDWLWIAGVAFVVFLAVLTALSCCRAASLADERSEAIERRLKAARAGVDEGWTDISHSGGSTHG